MLHPSRASLTRDSGCRFASLSLDHRLQSAAVELDAQRAVAARDEQRVASPLHVAALHQSALAVPFRLAAQALDNHSLQQSIHTTVV